MGNISRIRDLADKNGVSISFLSQAIGKAQDIWQTQQAAMQMSL